MDVLKGGLNSVDVEELVLERVKTSCAARIRGQTLADLSVSCRHDFLCSMADDLAEDLVFHLTTWVPLEKLLGRIEKSVPFYYPASWWQAFKYAYFPNWLKRIFPVKMDTVQLVVDVKIGAVYPQLPIVFPKCGIWKFVNLSQRELKYGGDRLE